MVRLEPISEGDIETLRGFRNDPRISDWCRQTHMISERDQEKWFRRQNDDPTMHMFEVVNGDCVVGACGLTSICHIHKRAEFSLYIAPNFQRKGYAKSALKELLRFGFRNLSLNIIWGETFNHNPSVKLFENLGMVREGTRRDFYFKNGSYVDAHLYSVRRSEWVY